jgi:hypothetical protein
VHWWNRNWRSDVVGALIFNRNAPRHHQASMLGSDARGIYGSGGKNLTLGDESRTDRERMNVNGLSAHGNTIL